VAEGARLESVFRGNSNVGSNPTLSASPFAFIDLSAIHTGPYRKTQPEERYAMLFPVSLLSQLIVPRPARSLPLSIFSAPKLAKELPNLHEFCSGPTFATTGRSE
jgi:hypothetical protein